ncbi:hypothetical protein SteCoe_37553 [Stentor coeruleus]|uniref:Uncharacterized protein n=1 Tax=Stentor coeruleus TaxID=5963 RepID=A0A1R2AMT7_9CILI|nr:hypothetical protein SteCoe_37553 [Stentor coeruleus]
MDEKCCICNLDLSKLEFFDRLIHTNSCLDQELSKEQIQDDTFETQKNTKLDLEPESPTSDEVYDYTGMPDYANMPKKDLKKHLGNYGMKKTLDTKLARIVLKETWLYINHGIYPKFLSKLTCK